MDTILDDENLEYISQTRESYTVKTNTGKEIAIAKAYLANTDDRVLHHDFRQKWMQLAVVGLPLGGILTIIFSPLVIWKNLNLLQHESLTKRERIHAKNFIIISLIFLIPGIVFFGLFIMHLIY